MKEKINKWLIFSARFFFLLFHVFYWKYPFEPSTFDKWYARYGFNNFLVLKTRRLLMGELGVKVQDQGKMLNEKEVNTLVSDDNMIRNRLKSLIIDGRYKEISDSTLLNEYYGNSQVDLTKYSKLEKSIDSLKRENKLKKNLIVGNYVDYTDSLDAVSNNDYSRHSLNVRSHTGGSSESLDSLKLDDILEYVEKDEEEINNTAYDQNIKRRYLDTNGYAGEFGDLENYKRIRKKLEAIYEGNFSELEALENDETFTKKKCNRNRKEKKCRYKQNVYINNINSCSDIELLDLFKSNSSIIDDDLNYGNMSKKNLKFKDKHKISIPHVKRLIPLLLIAYIGFYFVSPFSIFFITLFLIHIFQFMYIYVEIGSKYGIKLSKPASIKRILKSLFIRN